jgi:hypothetical protein
MTKYQLNPGITEHSDYTDVYNIFVNLVDKKLLSIPLNAEEQEAVNAGSYPNPVDTFIVDLFELVLPSDNQTSWRMLNALVRNETFPNWIFGPHALTLIKAKMAKRGMKL